MRIKLNAVTPETRLRRTDEHMQTMSTGRNLRIDRFGQQFHRLRGRVSGVHMVEIPAREPIAEHDTVAVTGFGMQGLRI